MKNRLLNFLSVILATALGLYSVISVNAETLVTWEDFPDYVFYVDISDSQGNSTYAVSSYVGENPDPVIPTSAHGHSILRLGEKCFYNNSTVKSITMHDNMTHIRKWAARSCSNLNNVYYSNKMVVIDDYAFANNPVMDSALLRNTVINTIGVGAYSTDPMLKYVAFPDTLKVIGEKAFLQTNMEKIVIPQGVEEIGKRAFSSSTALKTIYIPATVKKIDQYAFYLSDNVTVYCQINSYAQEFCETYNVNYKLITAEDYPSNILADVNNDKVLNIRDVTTMQIELAKGESKEFLSQNCDVNVDCKFDVNDITYLQKYLAKVYDSFPY